MDEDKSIANVVEYIRGFEPGAANKAAGADDASIYAFDKLVEEFTNMYLPPDYFEFLRLMGLQTPIPFANDASMNIAALHDYYQTLRRADGERFDVEHIIIAHGGRNLEQLALECLMIDEAGYTRSGRVFYATGNEALRVLADSFPNYLYRRAFEHCASNHLRLNATYNSAQTEPILPVINDYIGQFGWRKQWFSDSAALCMSAPNNDFVLCALQSPGQTPWLRIAGDNKNQISLLGAQICQRTNLELERWWS